VEESQHYFDTRPRGSRIGAWSSAQSSPLASREILDERVREHGHVFEGQEQIPVPPFWGGARVVPVEMEFWQGRENRLHDRFQFTRQGSQSAWEVKRLYP